MPSLCFFLISQWKTYSQSYFACGAMANPPLLDFFTPCSKPVFPCTPLPSPIVRAMKNVELIELTLDQLGGKEPIVGNDLVLSGIHYHIMHVKLTIARSSKWKRPRQATSTPKWSLLVKKVNATT